MKRASFLLYIAGFLAAAAIVVGGTAYISNHYLSIQEANSKSVVACKKLGQQHDAVIRDNSVNPKHTDGKLCETLKITNSDSEVLLIAFGSHDNHLEYDGITEKRLEPGQNLTITLNQAGTYQFHDHYADIVKGDFHVTK